MVTQLQQYKTGKFFRDEFRGDSSWNGNEFNNLLRNEGVENGIPKFADVAMAVGADDKKDCRGLAVADFDNDGDLDICINTNPGDHDKDVPIALLRNDVGDTRNSLVFDLKGSDSNRNAIGAIVRVELDSLGSPKVLTRHVQCGSGYAAQSDFRLFFGMGDCETARKVTVTWPSGSTQEFTNVAANQFVSLVEGQSVESQPFSRSSR